MKLVIGTTNPAKFRRYKTILEVFPTLEVFSLNDFENIPDVAEDGQTAEENARKKAQTYSVALNLPVLSIDESMTIPALPQNEQPGVNVRRYLGFPATDEQLLKAFLEKIRLLPEEKCFTIWVYAINLSFPDGRDFFDNVRLIKPLTLRPSLPIIPGYPLSSIMVDEKSGKLLRDLSAEEEREHLSEVYEKVGKIVRLVGLIG